MALSDADNGEGGDSDAIVTACVLGGFSESSETRVLISSLPEVHGDTVTSESTTQRFLGETVLHRVSPEINTFGSLITHHILPISSHSDNEQISRAASSAGPTSRYI